MPFGACTKTVMSFLQVDDNFLDLSLVKGHLITIYSFFLLGFTLVRVENVLIQHSDTQ